MCLVLNGASQAHAMIPMAMALQTADIIESPVETPAAATDCHGNPLTAAHQQIADPTDVADQVDPLADCCQTDACHCGCAQHASAMVAHASVAMTGKVANDHPLPGYGHARFPPERLIRPPIA